MSYTQVVNYEILQQPLFSKISPYFDVCLNNMLHNKIHNMRYKFPFNRLENMHQWNQASQLLYPFGYVFVQMPGIYIRMMMMVSITDLQNGRIDNFITDKEKFRVLRMIELAQKKQQVKSK